MGGHSLYYKKPSSAPTAVVPLPENLDPTLTGQLGYESASVQQTNLFLSAGLPIIFSNTATCNFGYNQGVAWIAMWRKSLGDIWLKRVEH